MVSPRFIFLGIGCILGLLALLLTGGVALVQRHTEPDFGGPDLFAGFVVGSLGFFAIWCFLAAALSPT